jgi:hypothetical protein
VRKCHRNRGRKTGLSHAPDRHGSRWAEPDFDPAFVRHIYDLHVLRDHVDRGTVIALARDIAAADADEFRNQYPAYHADIAGETFKALDALRNDLTHRERYDRFVSIMVYGELIEFGEAMKTVDDAWRA